MSNVTEVVSQPDWFGGWLIPVLVGVLGLIGVGVGGWLASGSALRIRLMDITQRHAESQRDFQIRVVTAVNAIGIAMAHAIDTQERSVRSMIDAAVAEARASGMASGTIELSGHAPMDPVAAERVSASTESWRAVLAEAHAFTDSAMSTAFEEFDTQRALVIDTLNAATDLQGIQQASQECDMLRERFGRQIYRVLQVEKAKGTWRMYQLAHIRRIRALSRQVSSVVADEIVRGEKLIASGRREISGETSERG